MVLHQEWILYIQITWLRFEIRNILLTEELLPIIADFGLAKQIPSNNDSKTTESEFGFKGTKNLHPIFFFCQFLLESEWDD